MRLNGGKLREKLIKKKRKIARKKGGKVLQKTEGSLPRSGRVKTEIQLKREIEKKKPCTREKNFKKNHLKPRRGLRSREKEKKEREFEKKEGRGKKKNQRRPKPQLSQQPGGTGRMSWENTQKGGAQQWEHALRSITPPPLKVKGRGTALPEEA